MSNNKQSSVEWLDNELASLHFDYLTGRIDNKDFNERHEAIIKQAKAMHKEEIFKSYEEGYRAAKKNVDPSCKCGLPKYGGYSCSRTDCDQTFNTNQENLPDSTNGYTYYPQENKTVFNSKEK